MFVNYKHVQGKEVDIIFEGAQSVRQHSYTWNAASLPLSVDYIRLQTCDVITSQNIAGYIQDED